MFDDIFVGVQSSYVFIVIMEVVGFVLDYLHGTNDLKMFTNDRMIPKVKQLHMFEQPQNPFANLVLNSYEKLGRRNSHDVFIYNSWIQTTSFPLKVLLFGPIVN